MKIEFPPYLIIGLSIGLIILMLLLMRGHDNEKSLIRANAELSIKNKKISADNANYAAKNEEYQQRNDMQEGIIEIKENQLVAKDDSLSYYVNRISEIAKKHIPIQAATDTSITTVPNEYIEDCEGCFTELNKGKLLITSYQNNVSNLKLQYGLKTQLDSNYIRDLKTQNDNLSSTLHDIMQIAQKTEKPKRILYFSISTMFFNTALPGGVGAGLIYQDQRKRMFDLKCYGTNKGIIYTGGLSFPLSFKNAN